MLEVNSHLVHVASLEMVVSPSSMELLELKTREKTRRTNNSCAAKKSHEKRKVAAILAADELRELQTKNDALKEKALRLETTIDSLRKAYLSRIRNRKCKCVAE
jgi:molecular chaperone GrpE (heat shock protein)